MSPVDGFRSEGDLNISEARTTWQASFIDQQIRSVVGGDAQYFSIASSKALDHALKFSMAFSKPLLILHVLHDPGNAPGSYSKLDQADKMIPMEQVAHEKFEKFLRRQAADRDDLERDQLNDAIKIVVAGVPVTRILEVAEREYVSMIILGSHSRNGLSRLIVGSVALDVVKRSKVPVTVVVAG